MVNSLHLNETQIDRLSEILGNLSLVFFGAQVLPSLLNKEIPDLFQLVTGLILSILCLSGSMALLKGKRL